MKDIISILILSFISGNLCAQELHQQVSGSVKDKALLSPLSGANVTLTGSTDTLRVVTDTLGFFVMPRVLPGRYRLIVSFVGFQTWQQDVLVISARMTAVNVLLEEFSNVLEEVEVTGNAGSLSFSNQSITIEKTLRVPANFFDPVRVLTSYPGIVSTSDQNNTIIVRGNSPTGLLWRINGLDVVNPNHLANAGTFSDKPATYGGGVNIISAQVLDRTDFYSGALPPRYGNALAGVVDMSLRSGNTDKAQYTAQASLIGLDMAAEGPLGKNRRGSFLVNYRYSTVGLLSAMGVNFGDESIGFQDLTFSLQSELQNGSKISVFGFYGSSHNNFEFKDSTEWEVDKDKYDIDYASQNFGTGVTVNRAIKKIHLASGIALSGSNQTRDQLASSQLTAGRPEIIYEDNYKATKMMVSSFCRLSAKSETSIFDSGIIVNYMIDELEQHNQSGGVPNQELSGKVNGFLLQPYVNWKMILSQNWITHTAMRYVYYSYNQTGSVEPRIAVEYFPTAKTTVKLSYSLMSQVQQPGTYLNNNEKLPLSKAHHLELGYGYLFDNGMEVTSSVYYQRLFDIPVEKSPSSYSAINLVETTALPDLIGSGTGKNIGAEITAEKSFFDRSYFIVGGSWYQSTYQGSDEVKRSTRFDGTYTFTLTYGKEWSKMKKGSHRAFGVSSRFLSLGGLRESPIIPDVNSPSTVFDETHAFENKLPDYFRFDVRFNWRKNKKGYTRTIAIDIQNIFNLENVAYRYYDHVLGKINTQYQLGMIPIVVYRIDF